MGEENVTGNIGIVGEWVIKDGDGNVKERGTDIPTPEKEAGGEKKKV